MILYVRRGVNEICGFVGGILCGLDWYFLTDVSGQPIGPIFKGQAPRHLRMVPVGSPTPASSVRIPFYAV